MGAKKPGKPRKMDPELAAKAAEIARRSGLPMGLANQVARGRLSLNDALKKLMEREKVERLAKQHGFEVPLAQAVVWGKVTLEHALLAKGLRECPDWKPDRSVLHRLRDTSGEATFFAFGEEPFVARVADNERFDVVLAVEGQEERRLPKHLLKLIAETATAEELAPLIGMDETVAAREMGPSTSYRDRFRSKKRILFKHYRGHIPTRVVLRDGTVLVGFVGWFGKWEFELALVKPRKKLKKAKMVAKVVVFRHALFSLDPAE